ncbi:MAG: hypothetical protein RLZZ135_1517, partial [Cyanobacteriota bacterium]
MLPISSTSERWVQPLTSSLLLLLWIVLGATLRLTDLELKPPWVEEFATLLFSIGNSFQSVALDRIISFPDLLAPLVPNPHATVSDVARRVIAEDSLAILWTIISICCLAIACGQISRQQQLPILLIIIWVIVNNLGLATHYFFGIGSIAEALVLGCLFGWQVRHCYPKLNAHKSYRSSVRATLLHP